MNTEYKKRNANHYGTRCQVVGYEWSVSHKQVCMLVCIVSRDVPIIGSVTISADDMLFFTISVIGTACTGSRYKATNYKFLVCRPGETMESMRAGGYYYYYLEYYYCTMQH